MAYKRSDGRYSLPVYFDDERPLRKIKKAAKFSHQSASSFIAKVAEEAADRVMEERKSLAAER